MKELYKRKTRAVRLSSWIVALGLVTLSAALQPVRPLVFNGRSMAPTYSDNALAFTLPRDRELARGDVVVIRNSLGTIVKRVAYVAGDQILQFRLLDRWVDLVNNPVIKHKNMPRLRRTVVPPGMIYVLGDNRIRSVDSRTFGFVAVSDVQRIVINPREAPTSEVRDA